MQDTSNPSASPYEYPYNQQPQVPMAPIMTMKDWIITLLIMMIPLINIIMMFVWAFGEGNPNRKNYFKATLLIAVIILGLYLVFGVIIVGLIMSNL